MTAPTTPVHGFGLGLIPDAPDDRDRVYAAPPVPYEFVDLESDPATPPVWNQLQLGACSAHGTLACFLWASAKCGANDPMLSRLMCYYLARQAMGAEYVGQDSGAQIRDAIKATTQGIAPESDWPYDISTFTNPPSSAAVADAAENVDLDYRRVPVTADAIQACLSEGFPVDIGVLLDPAAFESNDALNTGLVSTPAAAEDGHCMAIWGVGTGADWQSHGQFTAAPLDPARRYGKVRNSWGPDVYQRGYLLMDLEEYLGNPDLGSDYWTIRRVS